MPVPPMPVEVLEVMPVPPMPRLNGMPVPPMPPSSQGLALAESDNKVIKMAMQLRVKIFILTNPLVN
jgi:hypothetical protein